MLTAPHIGRSHTRPGHTESVSHLPSHSHFRQVGNPGPSRSPGLRTDPVTPSLEGSCPSDRGHLALPGPPPALTEPHNYFPRCRPLTLLLHTQNGTLHVPCVCPTALHPPPPQHESTKTHRTSWNFLGDLLIARWQLALRRGHENWNYSFLGSNPVFPSAQWGINPTSHACCEDELREHKQRTEPGPGQYKVGGQSVFLWATGRKRGWEPDLSGLAPPPALCWSSPHSLWPQPHHPLRPPERWDHQRTCFQGL